MAVLGFLEYLFIYSIQWLSYGAVHFLAAVSYFQGDRYQQRVKRDKGDGFFDWASELELEEDEHDCQMLRPASQTDAEYVNRTLNH